MKQTTIAIAAIVLAILITVIVHWEELVSQASDIERACLASGGIVRNAPCCKSAGDFPNLCLIGACGCSPDNSHEVKVCDCGSDKCFDGAKCVKTEP